ncbi:MAG: hypothetical protein ACR2QC_09895 [Gammaproteobacteria bacterium]
MADFFAAFGAFWGVLTGIAGLVFSAFILIAGIVAHIGVIWGEICRLRRLPSLRFCIGWIGTGAGGGAAMPFLFAFINLLSAEEQAIFSQGGLFSLAAWGGMFPELLALMVIVCFVGAIVGAIYACFAIAATYVVWRCINRNRRD